jgi:hypothetical protein
MKPIIGDPVVLLCGGIILIGFFSLIWAILKFSRLGKTGTPSQTRFDDILSSTDALRAPDLGITPARSFAPSASTSGAGSPTIVSKEVADRLDGMTQRLAEMQMLLSKQPAADPAGHAGMGQGFSPETIDKLLKIIGNVIQQVDILQKNINPSKDGPSSSVTKL